MILEIDLEPEMVERLRAKAIRKGLSGRDYARAVVLADLALDALQDRTLHNAMEFAGAGREALRDIDVDKFIRDMRDEWEDRS